MLVVHASSLKISNILFSSSSSQKGDTGRAQVRVHSEFALVPCNVVNVEMPLLKKYISLEHGWTTGCTV